MTADSQTILGPDPLPQRYFTPDDGIGGRLKQRPEDFIVEELPLYEPSGEGEHLYLRIRKRSVAHGELMSHLRRHFQVRDTDIGYAGMKDKLAVTTQTVSIRLPRGPENAELEHDRIDVLWATRHRNKLKRGHLAGNRFVICIRDVDPLSVPRAYRTLRQLEATGAPAYFGQQRFGYRRNNQRMGTLILREQWTELLDELLGPDGAPFPEYQRERRDLFAAGRLDEAAAQWATADRSELTVINSLRRGKSPKQAVARLGHSSLTFMVNAVGSAIFNRVLDRRIDEDTVGTLQDGDLAWKHDSRAVFRVTDELQSTGDLDERLARFEISPSGPVWGYDMTEAEGDALRIERAALAALGLTTEHLAGSRYRQEGVRRPFRTPITNTQVEGGMDEHGPYVKTAFDLPRGMYATVALRELMKNEEPLFGGTTKPGRATKPQSDGATEA